MPVAGSYSLLAPVLGYPAGVVPVTRVRANEEMGRAKSSDVVHKTAWEADQGSAGYISGTSDAGWDIDNLKQLRSIHGTDLEVVATGPITPYRWTPPSSPSC